MKKLSRINVVLVRSPQPYLLADDGKLFSPNRLMTPETKVAQLDLRDFRKGGLVHHHYGNLELSYVDSILRKIVSGVSIVNYFDKNVS